MINTQLPALVTHVMSLTALKLVYTLFNQASSVGQVHPWMFQWCQIVIFCCCSVTQLCPTL